MTIQNTKEALNKDMENLRKKRIKIKSPLVKQKTQWKATPAD
jgi:hypothetical protein